MKKDWTKYLLAVVVILLIIPLGVAFMLSFRFIITDTTNEWIGFWGGYLGSIIGGVVTLVALKYTIKDSKENLEATLNFEKQRMISEKKTEFNEELLKQLVEYQTGIENVFNLVKNKKTEDDFMSKVHRYTILSKLIVTKLESKKENSDYIGAEKLLSRVINTTSDLNQLVGIVNDELGGKTVDVEKKEIVQNNVKEEIDKLMDGIEEYYVVND